MDVRHRPLLLWRSWPTGGKSIKTKSHWCKFHKNHIATNVRKSHSCLTNLPSPHWWHELQGPPTSHSQDIADPGLDNRCSLNRLYIDISFPWCLRWWSLWWWAGPDSCSIKSVFSMLFIRASGHSVVKPFFSKSCSKSCYQVWGCLLLEGWDDTGERVSLLFQVRNSRIFPI